MKYNRKFKDITGQYNCTLEYKDPKTKEIIIEHRPVWLFQNENIPVNITEIWDLIPGTTVDCWTPVEQFDEKAMQDLLGAMARDSVKEVTRACKYISEYPKKHNRLHCKPRKDVPVPFEIQEGTFGLKFIKGTQVENELLKILRKDGIYYNIEKLEQDWIKENKKKKSASEYQMYKEELEEAYKKVHLWED